MQQIEAIGDFPQKLQRPQVQPGVPFTFGTTIAGINDLNQIVGSVDSPDGTVGFVATPCSGSEPDCIALKQIGAALPEPGILALLLLAFVVGWFFSETQGLAAI